MGGGWGARTGDAGIVMHRTIDDLDHEELAPLGREYLLAGHLIDPPDAGR